MIAVVVSRADHASEHIGEQLLAETEWTAREDETRPDAEGGGRYYRTDGFELREFDALHLDIEDAADAFADPDMLVFASRHSGDTGPLLTAHFTGNFGPAQFGGEDGELARACPNAHARLLRAFDEHAPPGYDVGAECTHHGPSGVGVPSMFAELGSDEEQWRDSDAARAVARAILDLRGVEPTRERQFVGFGGGHYAPRFERIVRETDWAVGHVASDWNLEAMGSPAENRATIRRAFERSDAEYAVREGDYPELESVVADLGYRTVSETWVRETSGVPLPLVERLETDLSPVESGLRFGDLAGASEEFEVVELPDDLLAAAAGIDRERVRGLVAERTLAFETEEGGTLAAGNAAVRGPSDYDAVVDELAGLLGEKYDDVERAAEEVVVRESAFDPEKARQLGVPEGPEFGKLSSGVAVTVNDETIPPDAVRTERVRRYRV
ncbi:D-aminoacyl-tRNA deacylase [Haladaptatus salinisoli]|uniref:D-aminoacyl-tRNA deacylase n=1 Tax=Haladaptatus salinisoli TaxID=2884876 RepID=UPI001D0A93B1|nr:D-aminoacyl-tRNA deacylase [Haladaptatus salinisoli]